MTAAYYLLITYNKMRIILGYSYHPIDTLQGTSEARSLDKGAIKVNDFFSPSVRV